MPLEKVCLAVKLLYPHTMISEYFQETITIPHFLYVRHATECLKKINALDHLENVTWLGCRLIDLPLECQLGKMLIYGVLFQCLDPILTIVSFIQTSDPFDATFYLYGTMTQNKDIIRQRLRNERIRLSGSIPSDFVVYLRLYQEWQNEASNYSTIFSGGNYSCESKNCYMYDEPHYIVNGVLEQISLLRTQIVGALRSSQLIHNRGNLSMNYINQKSNCWPLVKAAIIGGLYPNICLLDYDDKRIKSPRKRELLFHPDSVLRTLEFEAFDSFKQRFKSPWVVYGIETNSWNCNSISSCTLVSPVAIALFAGK